jgi:signal transduction histidine kinase
VALELAQVAAGFPLAASFAIAGGITALREGRRRSSLNEAMHELRRPLQVLALSLPADPAAAKALDSSLRMATAAIERLDREINGGRPSGEVVEVPLRALVEAAVERWRVRAAEENRPLGLRWAAGDPCLRGDEVELGQAVDNLISNAFEHGGGEIVVEVREDGDMLRLAVRDAGGPETQRSRGVPRIRARLSGRSRHGHGLKLVRRAAAQHGGGFRLCRSAAGTEARLELPLTGGAG